MARQLSLLGLLLAAFFVPALSRAQEEDPTFRGRRLSEWLAMLKGGEAAEDQQALLFVLGNSAGLPSMWPRLVNTRMAGLLAVELIGLAKSPKVLPAILAVLRDDPEPRVREAAAHALGRLGPKARDEKIRFDDARDALISAMRTDTSGPVRKAAATALGQLGPDAEKAVLSLAAALKDTYPDTQAAAAATLHRLGTVARDALPELQTVLRDPKANVLTRLYSIKAVGAMGPDAASALTALVEVLTDAKAPTDLRAAAAEAIGRLGKAAAEAVPVLAKMLTASDSPLEVRRAAALALDELGTDARPALAALKRALKDSDKFVRCTALHAIGGLGKELGTERHDVVTALFICLNDSVLEVRVAAIEALGNLGAAGLGDDLKVVLDKLTEAERDSRKDVKEAAQNALKKLKPMP
jgi:HEAT repeat protein